MWGSNARDAHPIFFHHVLAGVRNGARLFVVDPRRSSTATFADRWLGLNVGHRRRALEHDRPGDHPRRAGRTPRSSSGAPPGSTSTRRRSRTGRSNGAKPSPGCPPMRSASSPTPTPRPPSAAVLDARHHRAPQRRRQRAQPDQPGAAVRARRAHGLGAQPAARPEQRAGRRRHGCVAEQAARASKTSKTTRPGPASRRPGTPTIPPRNGWHLTEMFDAMGRGDLRALYVIGENPAQSEADGTHAIELLERPRPSRGAGHLPHQDRTAGRRRAARHRHVVRGRGHGDQLRASGATHPQGARPARSGPR